MRDEWFIECWHSGDTDEGHSYTFTARSAADAVSQLLMLLWGEGVNPDSVTYIQVESAGEPRA